MKKFFATIQENGMFGATDAVRKEFASQLSLHDAIRGMKWEKALKTLKSRGISEYQTSLIHGAVWEDCFNNGFPSRKLVLDYDSVDDCLNSDIAAISNLKSHGLIYSLTTGGKCYLTEGGQALWETLGFCYQANNPKALKEVGVPYYLDINLSRDGIVGTCKKISWLLRNRSAVQTYRTELFLQNLQTDQKLLDNTLNLIATSEQRVARKLIEQGPKVAESTWTEEQQRAQNDLYWLTDSLSAFWLNPMGLLADPTPAPEWWSPPETFESATQKFINLLAREDIVFRSLQAPQGSAPKKSKEEILDEVIADLEELSKNADEYNVWKQKLYPKDKDLFVVEAGGLNHCFETRAEADAFTSEYQNKIRNKKTIKEYNACKEYGWTASTNTKEMYYTGVILPSNRGD